MTQSSKSPDYRCWARVTEVPRAHKFLLPQNNFSHRGIARCSQKRLRRYRDYRLGSTRYCCGISRPRRAAPPRVCRPRHDAVLSISRSSRPRSSRFRFARRADFHLVIDRALPPARAGSAEARDNLVSSTVSTLRSAVMRRVVARGQLECVCPWRLAPSQPRQRRELRSPPAVREA